MDNLEIFKGYEKKYKGTLVLDHFDVVLFCGMKYDDPEDYYYVLRKYAAKKTFLASGVGRLVFLKSTIPSDDYLYLVQVWNYNNKEKAT